MTFTQKTGYKAENYDIKYEPGTLRITPIVDEVTITITEHSASLKYNGAEQSVTGYDTAIDTPSIKKLISPSAEMPQRKELTLVHIR